MYRIEGEAKSSLALSGSVYLKSLDHKNRFLPIADIDADVIPNFFAKLVGIS